MPHRETDPIKSLSASCVYVIISIQLFAEESYCVYTVVETFHNDVCGFFFFFFLCIVENTQGMLS